MASAIFKLLVYSILLNISVGIMSNALPLLSYTGMGVSDTGGYDPTFADEFTTEMNNTLQEVGSVESTNFFDRLLDKIGLGIVSKVLRLAQLDKYMFGFVAMLEKIFGVTDLWLMGFIRGAMTFAYVFGAVKLWTNKDVTVG